MFDSFVCCKSARDDLAVEVKLLEENTSSDDLVRACATPGKARVGPKGLEQAGPIAPHEIQLPFTATEPKRLILVSDNLPGFEVLIKATLDNVVVVPVQYSSWTLDTLQEQIACRAGLPAQQFMSVALLDHGKPGEFCLLKSVMGGSVDLKEIKESEPLQNFLKHISGYVKKPKELHEWKQDKDSRIDLLGCCIAQGQVGAELIDYLEELTRVNWCVSVDATGAGGEAENGFDWVMESDPNVGCVADYYFEKTKLIQWQHTASFSEEKGRHHRFSCFLGRGCWPVRSAAYEDFCCGKITTLCPEHWEVYQKHLAHEKTGGDWVKAMLRSYSGQEIYSTINMDLLEGRPALKSRGGYVHHLKEAIKWRVNNVGCSKGTLYRGMSVKPELVHLYRTAGREFVWPNFVSASHSEHVARELGFNSHTAGLQKILFEINTGGEGFTHVVDIADISEFPDELEALFYPYSAFVIADHSQQGDVVIVRLKTLDSTIYFNGWLQKFEELRFSSEKQLVPLSQCFYKNGDSTSCAVSSALVPRYESCGAKWGTCTSTSALAKMINKHWEQKMHVLFLCAGASEWSIFSVDKAVFGCTQSYKYHADANEMDSWISKMWKDKYSITGWAVNDEDYFVLMTREAPGFETGQRWATRSKWSEMEGWMTQGFGDGYIITDSSYSSKKKQYGMVMTQSSKTQRVTSSQTFPKDWVSQQWKAGLVITKIMYNIDEDCPNEPWFVVMTSDSGSCNAWTHGLGAR
eukprot:TRINITY_DN47334_c0_g1_i1.p1 TRINITY_DN47334_c0_g1~~TRINITY_DN47334_c0_g1_i1.p1  ORF type:complete len:747 (+),score=123.84 TRINITY_DN47334_c0_g1_i1:69-2309(+)